MEFEAVIGLEVHAQLLTESKIFCGCSTTFGAEPNTHTCPVCLGMPGVLPVLNRRVVEYALRMCLATHCTPATVCQFARKHYFYPDLPKGYQISQYERPLAEHGHVTIHLEDLPAKRIGIQRIHMEEDAGKLVHDERRPVSHVDFNRTGVPLIEIVSEPDIRSPDEAVAYLKSLRDILMYLEICDGNMEEGSFRCDANISVRPTGEEPFGVRTELKNMNSFRNVHRALAYEIQRQGQLLSEKGVVVQETRLWDEHRQITFSMRGKEEAHDYRYFPDPDLVPLRIDGAWLDQVKMSLPELPEDKRGRFVSQYGLREYDAGILTASKALADFFESCVEIFDDPRQVFNWVTGDLLRELNRDDRPIEDCPITPRMLAKMLQRLREGRISRRIAQQLFEEMYRTGKDPDLVIDERGWAVVADRGALEEVVDKVLSEHPAEVEAYRGGKTKLLGFFMGRLMKRTKGQADPKLAQQLLQARLDQAGIGQKVD